MKSTVHNKFFNKKTSGGAVKSEILSNHQLSKELHKPIIRKFEKQKLHSSFTYNIWGTDLEDIHLIKDFDFYYFLLIFIVNMHRLFL